MHPNYCKAALLSAGMMLMSTLTAAEVIRLIPLSEVKVPAGSLGIEDHIAAATVRQGEALSLGAQSGIGFVVRLREETALSGILVIASQEGAPRLVDFTVSKEAVAAAADGSKAYAQEIAQRAARHLRRDDFDDEVIPTSASNGAQAWWTWRIEEASRLDPGIAPANQRRRDGDDLDDTLDFFSGMTALSENLQFNRTLTIAGEGAATVAISSLPTLTMREVPWDQMPSAKDPLPTLDQLAKRIPADQHALLLPSFTALATTVEQGDALLAGPLQMVSGRGEDAGILRRYQRQLGLELTELSKRFGAQVVESVAITGSDPFLRAGTDVAILFQAKQPALLAGYLELRRQSLIAAGAKLVTGTTGGLAWQGAVTTDRTVSCYVLIDGDVAVVTNSLVQIEAYADVRAKKRPTLASVPEMTFFRRRYPLGSDGEIALTVISDATIRRWCSAACRIGDSRRTRAALILGQYQAEWITAGCPPTWQPTIIRDDLGAISIDPKHGVRSSVYGSIHFLTPVAELAIENATAGEAAAFRRFIERYESSWRDALDPIALRIQTKHDGSLGFDLSVLPLIVSSDYVDLLGWVGKAQISAGNGDAHDAPFQIAIAMDKDGEVLGEANDFAGRTLGGLASPFSWLGDTASLYADEDPFWNELAQVDEDKREHMLERRLSELPVGVNIAVRDPLKLAAFLTALRAFAEQSAPNMLSWKNVTFGDVTYVQVSPNADARRGLLGNMDVSLFYLPAAEGLTLTMSQRVMERAITRLQARRAANANPVSDPTWDGNQAALRFNPLHVSSLYQIFDQDGGITNWMHSRNADTIAILNEWRRLFPQEDPVAVHERLWGTRPVCLGGGTYRWNETWMTMESSVLGHEHSSDPSPNFPIGLEKIGLITTALSFEDIPNAVQAPGALAPGEIEAEVQPGDTWFSLAGEHGVNANALAQRNRAQVDQAPAAGRKIIIPRWDADRSRSVGLRVRINLRPAKDKAPEPAKPTVP